MGARSLLPGYGSQYLSVEVGSTDTFITDGTGDLTLDLSLCDAFAIQVLSTQATPAGTLQLSQSFNNSSYSNLGSTINVATDVATLFEETDGPFGKIKIDATGMTAGSIKVAVVGFARYKR